MEAEEFSAYGVHDCGTPLTSLGGCPTCEAAAEQDDPILNRMISGTLVRHEGGTWE